MTGLLQDFFYALRQLRKAPVFAAVAVLTLALGIGANTAIYSLLDQALLRRLPVNHPEDLVLLQYTGTNRGRVSSYGGDDSHYFSYPMYRDLRDQNSVFRGMLATDAVQVGVQWHNQPELVDGELVSGNYFEVLGVKPAGGRLFVASDDQAENANPVAVLSYGYWRRRFGSDPGVIGQSILINAHPFQIIGVSPANFHSVVAGQTPDIFTPMMMKPEVTPGWKDLDNRRSAWLNIVARLKPGITPARAEAAMLPLWRSIRAEELKSIKTTAHGFREGFVNQSRLMVVGSAKGFSPLRDAIATPLLIIMAMVGLVALMAAANVASLLLVRAATRTREMSVRYALGAERFRILRQLLVEGLILGASGGALGFLLAPQVTRILMRELMGGSTGDMPFSSRLDLRILLFNLALSLAVSVLFSLAPAVQFWRPNLMAALKQQLVTAEGGPLRFRRVSVAVQIGLSLLLLVGAGLFVRTLHNLKTLDAGFVTSNLLTFRISPRIAGYSDGQTPALYQRVLDTLKALPGVTSAAATNSAELADSDMTSNITVAGYKDRPDENMDVQWTSITPDYFSTLKVPILFGRALTEQEDLKGAHVAVVNETFARYFFRDPRKAVGQYFGHGGGPETKTDIEIIGVAGNAKHGNMREEFQRTAFLPHLRDQAPLSMSFYIRTSQSPANAQNMVRVAMQKLDSHLVLGSFRTMEEQIDNTLSNERMVALLAGSFAILAVFMAGVGLYGVLAYATAQRTREIGLRIALGSSRSAVLRMVLTEVLWLAGLGVAVALPVTLLLARTLRSQLFGISSNDPLTILSVILLLAVVAAVAALIPARRAAGVDPMVALRYE